MTGPAPISIPTPPREITRGHLFGWTRGSPRAVIFVHGFTGTAAATWKNQAAAFSFPQLLFADDRFSDFDVYVFQYRTGILHATPIENVVKQLADEIASDELKDKEIVLVAHSLGGLVAMEYVLSQLRAATPVRVAGLMTYGTPMLGVELVNYLRVVAAVAWVKFAWLGSLLFFLARLIGRNKQIAALQRDSAFVDRLLAEWALRVVNGGSPSIPSGMRGWVPMRVITANADWVVTEQSAKGVYGMLNWSSVDQGHVEMVKPVDRADASYKRAAEFLISVRQSMPPEVIERLRALSDLVWNYHQGKLIEKWRFEIGFWTQAEAGLPEAKFGLPGFVVFEVKQCSYTITVPEEPFQFGMTLGNIAAGAAWQRNPAYLHQIFLRGVSQEERDQVSKAIQDKLAVPDEAWECFFRRESLSISDPEEQESHTLVPGKPQVAADALIRSYSLPDDARKWFGKRARLHIRFESLHPSPFDNFTVQFPWLCHGFEVTAAVHGKTDYVVAIPSMLVKPSGPEEPPTSKWTRVHLNSGGVVLPGSFIQLEWQRSKNKEAIA